jgi:hypothetical protein
MSRCIGIGKGSPVHGDRSSRKQKGKKKTDLEDLEISFKDSLRRKRGHRDINHLQEEAEVGEEPTQGGIPTMQREVMFKASCNK